MSQRPEHRPGEPAPEDDEYEALNIFGRPIGMTEIVRKGEPLPELPRGFTWRSLGRQGPG